MALVCTALVALPCRTQAASLSGILVYAADQQGDPAGWDPQAPEDGNSRVWHTARDGKGSGLGLLFGTLPDSVQGSLLNGLDFSVDVTLSMGTNAFTLVGEPSGPSGGNQFEYFVIDLFFDGQLDEPGISVLFPRRGLTEGDTPNVNQSNQVFTLAVEESARGTPTMVYNNGSVRVSIDTVSFVPAQWPLIVNKVSASGPSPGDGNDWVGTLSLFVEASTTPGSGGGGGRGLLTNRPDVGVSIRIGPDLGGAPPGGSPLEGGTQAPSRAASVPNWQAADSPNAESTPPPTRALGSATPNTTPTPAATAQLPTLTARAAPAALTPTVKPSANAATAGTVTPAVQPTPDATGAAH